jgi:hypothetical protein
MGSHRGSKECRGCGSPELFIALDLGLSPIANSLPSLHTSECEPSYPLTLMICQTCQLGQIPEFETPDEIFSTYPYLSSTSSYWVEHAKNFSAIALERFPQIPNSYVLEIASNDGYLLQHFLEKGISVLGVDPARNVAEIANSKGIHTIPGFFGVDLAKDIYNDHGYPSLIVANNVAAHVPNMIDFFRGISELCGPETVVSIENPSLGFLLEKVYYDTIYHEHFSYLTVLPIQKLVHSLGMRLFDVETLATHGGSLRYWISKNSSLKIHRSVEEIKGEEPKNYAGTFFVILFLSILLFHFAIPDPVKEQTFKDINTLFFNLWELGVFVGNHRFPKAIKEVSVPIFKNIMSKTNAVYNRLY